MDQADTVRLTQCKHDPWGPSWCFRSCAQKWGIFVSPAAHPRLSVTGASQRLFTPQGESGDSKCAFFIPRKRSVSLITSEVSGPCPFCTARPQLILKGFFVGRDSAPREMQAIVMAFSKGDLLLCVDCFALFSLSTDKYTQNQLTVTWPEHAGLAFPPEAWFHRSCPGAVLCRSCKQEPRLQKAPFLPAFHSAPLTPTGPLASNSLRAHLRARSLLEARGWPGQAGRSWMGPIFRDFKR